MVVEEGGDGGFEVRNTAMDTAADLLFGQHCEAALDLLEPRSGSRPGTAGWGQVTMPARPLGQPVADQRGFVGGVIVPDQMHLEIRRHAGFDLIEALAALLCPVPRITRADDLAGGDVEGGEQRGGAMPGLVVAAPFRQARAHWKHWLAAIQCLDLRLLIHTEHQGVLGWGHRQPDDVTHLGNKIRIGGLRLEPIRNFMWRS